MSSEFIRRLPDNNIIKLRYETELNPFDTEKMGMKIYDRVLIATVIPPGGGNQEAVSEIKRMFGNKDRKDRINHKFLDKVSHVVEEFEKNNESCVIDGTPIEDVSFVHPSMVGMLKLKNIFTVEILAEVPDSVLAGLGMGGREMRDKAKYYIESQKTSAPLMALADENMKLKARLEKLESMITSGPAQEVSAPEPEKRKPGRPAKEQSEIQEASGF